MAGPKVAQSRIGVDGRIGGKVGRNQRGKRVGQEVTAEGVVRGRGRRME